MRPELSGHGPSRYFDTDSVALRADWTVLDAARVVKINTSITT